MIKQTWDKVCLKAYVNIRPSDPCVFSASLFASLLCGQRNSFPLKYR